jgi:hypothetical protein
VPEGAPDGIEAPAPRRMIVLSGLIVDLSLSIDIGIDTSPVPC